MKLYGQVTRISDTISIPAKEGKEPMSKKILCIEEMDDDKEVLDRVAVDFLGDKMDLIKDLKI